MISEYLANSLLIPKRHPIKKNPGDYGMEYEDIGFKSLDGVNLRGWYIPGASGKLIVMTNPMPFSRYGFSADYQGVFKITKLEVELLKTVKQLNGAGYDVIIIDLRNHGESDSADGGFCTVGMNEWQDVAGMMQYIASRDDLKEKPVGFMSLCTGANATIIAMSRAGELFRQVKCLFAVQPISADVFTKKILAEKFPLFKGFYGGINKRVKKHTGLFLEEMSPRDYVKDIPVPVTYAQTKGDKWYDKTDVLGFYENTPAEKSFLWLEGNERFDGYNYFGAHPEEMLAFFKRYMG
jgi:pimeloyl-ACP methyl ester carboxylesterase